MISLAKEKHLPEIDAIYNQAVEDGLRTAHLSPLDEEERKEWLHRHRPEIHPVFVWQTEGEVLGWLSISPYRSGRGALSEVAEISYYVHYNHHGKGIASALMMHGINFCRSIHFRILVAILISGNSQSIGLLNKFGFRESGRIKKAIHYKNIYRDHVYMSLDIGKASDL